MCYHIYLKSWSPCQHIHTFLTFIGFHPCVSIFVALEWFYIWKDFSTLFTCIELLSNMTPFMCSESTRRNKCLPTIFTFIYLLVVLLMFSWFVFNLTWHVSIKGWMTQEEFSTCTAFPWFKTSSFLHTESWNKLHTFSPRMNIFPFRESLYHRTSVNNEKHIINDLLLNYIYYDL